MPSAAPDSLRTRLRVLLSLAWPVVLTRATQSVIGFCDALMVAPLGEAELAAVTTGALNSFALIILPMGTVFILQSFVSQLRGRGELGRVTRYAQYGLLLSLLAGLAGVCAIPFLPRALSLIAFAPDVRAFMSEYLAIRLLSVAFAVGIEALGNWYGGLGNTRAAMQAGVVAMAVNVLGNYALIQPRWGLEGFGVAGAAWASVLGSAVGFFVLLGMFVLRRGYPAIAQSSPFLWTELWRVLRFGLPSGINWFFEFSAFALFMNVVVGHLGTTALAAFNVVIQLNSVAFMPAFGLASAGAILVGEAIGRRDYDGVWRTVKLTAQLTCLFMGTVGLLYLTIPEWLVGYFAAGHSGRASFLELAAWMLALSAVWQLFDGLGMTLGEALRAAGDTAWCMWARVVIAWVIFTPLSWLWVVTFDGGPTAVMLSMMVYMALLALVLGYRYRTGRWRGIHLFGAEPVLV